MARPTKGKVAIYMEGGGDKSSLKAELRAGMMVFLRSLRKEVEARRYQFDLIMCGGRQAAYDDFMNEIQEKPEYINILLVDSELHSVVIPAKDHLHQRDGWNFPGISPDQVHLMIACMESWIASDPNAIRSYYNDQNFRQARLPRRPDLENEPKQDLYNKLEAATQNTKKGSYAKITHASELLKKVNPELAKQKCPNCQKFFDDIIGLL